MALQHQTKRAAKKTILSAVHSASQSIGRDLSLRVITYSEQNNQIVASMRMLDQGRAVTVNHVFSTSQLPTQQSIMSSILNTLKRPRTAIMAADGEEDTDVMTADDDSDMGSDMMGSGDMADAVDDLTDAVNDIQDDLEDIQEDEVAIQTENNIEGHLIAECESCSGIFISAMVKSDQKVDSIQGVCPLCGKETTQKFSWFVAALDYTDGATAVK